MALKSLALGRRCRCLLWYVILVLFLSFRQSETESLGPNRLHRVIGVVDATAIGKNMNGIAELMNYTVMNLQPVIPRFEVIRWENENIIHSIEMSMNPV